MPNFFEKLLATFLLVINPLRLTLTDIDSYVGIIAAMVGIIAAVVTSIDRIQNILDRKRKKDGSIPS